MQLDWLRRKISEEIGTLERIMLCMCQQSFLQPIIL